MIVEVSSRGEVGFCFTRGSPSSAGIIKEKEVCQYWVK